MCGITGALAFNEVGRWSSLVSVGAANETLSHRGPDTSRLFDSYFAGMGHNRLSILDLSAQGWQPMSDKTGRYTIVYNGEIYNFKELKQQLQNKGVAFHSETDSEVVLQMYIHYKDEMLCKLNGFFAFAIFDEQERSLFMARDRFGIKPLLYYFDEDKLIFASEMKALLAYNIPKVLDYASLNQYFQLHCIPAPHTIFENVYKLSPGHYLTAQKKQVVVKSYYKSVLTQSYTPLSYEDAQKKVINLLEESVQKRLLSDVPLGAFLSGGTDSSVIVALAKKHLQELNTFSIGYKDEPLFDETNYANEVAKKFNTKHHVFELSNQAIFEGIFEMLDVIDEPFADSSAIPVYILSKKTRKHIIVALSGDGGDELFAGYNKYLGMYKASKGGFLANLLKNNHSLLDKLPKSRNTFWGNKFRQAHRLAEAMQLNAQERYWYLSSFFSESNTRHLFSQETYQKIQDTSYSNRKKTILSGIKTDDLNEILWADVKMVLPNDMLHKVDMMSMANGLEVRVPFLDHELVKFAFSLPMSYKLNGKMKKRVLQDAFKEILPKSLYNRPKHGFDVPLAKGFKTVLSDWIHDLLDPQSIEEQGILSVNYTEKLKQSVFHTTNFDQNHVWAILVFQHWWKKVMS